MEIKASAFCCFGLKNILIPSTVSEIGKDIIDKKVVIYCYPGTYGLEYARKHGYKTENALKYKI